MYFLCSTILTNIRLIWRISAWYAHTFFDHYWLKQSFASDCVIVSHFCGEFPSMAFHVTSDIVTRLKEHHDILPQVRSHVAVRVYGFRNYTEIGVHLYLVGPRNIPLWYQKCIYQAQFSWGYRFCEIVRTTMNVMGIEWWQVNSSTANISVSRNSKQSSNPMFIQIHNTTLCY